MIHFFLIGATLGASARAPTTVQSTDTARVAKVKRLSTEERVMARAARIHALERANDESWSALVAARREPKSALKNITLTASERQATRHIGALYLDQFEILDRDDKNSRASPPYTSTLIRDIGTLRLRQRAELRGALSREKRLRFDANVMALAAPRNAIH